VGHRVAVEHRFRRVLAKVGFTETERKEVDAVHGTTLFTTRHL
jgi:[ribosomal protein S5]-alanine N-acetyltransferase